MRLLALLTAMPFFAQTPPQVKVDTERVRAVIANEQPRRPSAMHEHKINRVLIYMGDGEVKFTSADGKVETSKFKRGDARWSPKSGPHISEYLSDQPFSIVEVELKNQPHPMPPSSLDPLKLDPRHYSLEFENDQARVLRVRFGPHEKGVRHEHQYDHIVVYLTDHAKGPAGTVKLEGPETHTEENPLDHAVERLAIDIK